MGKVNFSEWLEGAGTRRLAEASPAPETKTAPSTPPPPVVVPPAPKAPAVIETGLSGTVNWNGQLQTEANPKLRWESAYGNATGTTWGEWEILEKSDPSVATALNKLCAPLRDAEIQVEPAPEPDDGEAEELVDPASDTSGAAPADGPEYQTPKALANNPFAKDPAAEPKAAEGAGPPATAAVPPTPGAPAPKPVKTQNQIIAEFVADNFKKWIDPQWPTLLEQIVKYGLGYGFSLHESVWGSREDERVGGGIAWFVKKLSQRLPSSIKRDGWKEDPATGELIEIHQQGQRHGKWEHTIVLPADKVLLCTWNKAGDNYQGVPAFRPVWYIGTIRRELLKILAIGHARESCGVPVATMDNDTVLSPEQQDDLQALLEGVVYHENAGFQLPPGVKIDWFFSPGANKGNVLETWRQLGEAILQVTGTEGAALGSGPHGSNALGESKATDKNGFVEGIRAWVEGCLNGVGDQCYTGLVKRLVDLNFGPQKEYPKLKLVTKKGDLPLGELATAVKTLSDAGAITFTPKDEDFFRERAGMPSIDPVERETLKAEKDAKAAAIAGGISPGGDKPQLSPGEDKAPKKFAEGITLSDLLSLDVDR
jgi:hypothetical protein